jgi:hypothetical protein
VTSRCVCCGRPTALLSLAGVVTVSRPGIVLPKEVIDARGDVVGVRRAEFETHGEVMMICGFMTVICDRLLRDCP